MGSWILLAVAAQFLSAVSVLVDKHIVIRARAIGEPVAYAFFTSVFSGGVAVFALFGYVNMPSLLLVSNAILHGTVFFLALFLLYSALRLARASDVAPVVGGVSAIVSIILSSLIFGNDVEGLVLPAFLLAIGTAVISHFHFTKRALALTLSAGFCFGVGVILAKLVFEQTEFINGFFWTRIMGVFVALCVLFIPAARKKIFHGVSGSSHTGKLLVVGNKVLSGISGIMFALAISLGSVAVVNALTGLQFVFLFLFSLLFARFMPRSSPDSLAHGGWHTGVGISLIVSGFSLLALSL